MNWYPQDQQRIRFNLCHQFIGCIDDIADRRAKIIPHRIHVHFRIIKLQILKEHAVQIVIIILPRMGKNRIKILPAFRDHRAQTDDLRPRSHDDQKLQFPVFLE